MTRLAQSVDLKRTFPNDRFKVDRPCSPPRTGTCAEEIRVTWSYEVVDLRVDVSPSEARFYGSVSVETPDGFLIQPIDFPLEVAARNGAFLLVARPQDISIEGIIDNERRTIRSLDLDLKDQLVVGLPFSGEVDVSGSNRRLSVTAPSAALGQGRIFLRGRIR